MSAKEKVLSVGIDLGTSQSAIATSAGERHVVDSFVGWPVDMVAKKVLKKPVLIGAEALENRTMLDLHRPLEQGLIKEGSEKDLAAVKEILGHLISLATDGEKEGKVRAVVGVPAETMRVNKQQLRQILRGTVDSLIIVSEPFAVAYGIDQLLHSMIIDIGAGTTDFCVMKGRYPTLLDDPEQGPAARQLWDDAQKMLREVLQKNWFRPKAVIGFWPANAVGDDIRLFTGEDRSEDLATFFTLRQQLSKQKDKPNLALADFVAPVGTPDYIGGFVVTAGLWLAVLSFV